MSSTVRVVGSINMDVVAQVLRLPRPGETVPGRTLSTLPGGKGANQAVAASRAGARAAMVGAVGNDDFGRQLRAFLAEEKLDLGFAVDVDGPTGTALIGVQDDGENSIIVVPGANGRVTPSLLADVTFHPGDVVLLQNEIPQETNAFIAAKAQAAGAIVVLNAAPFREPLKEEVAALSFLIVNESEFGQLIDEPVELDRAQVVGRLTQGLGPDVSLIVTVGAEGVVVREGDRVTHIPGHRVTPVDATGAGDCFCGSFGAALAAGATPTAAAKYANAAAALSVTQLGAGVSMPTRADVESFLASR